MALDTIDVQPYGTELGKLVNENRPTDIIARVWIPQSVGPTGQPSKPFTDEIAKGLAEDRPGVDRYLTTVAQIAWYRDRLTNGEKPTAPEEAPLEYIESWKGLWRTGGTAPLTTSLRTDLKARGLETPAERFTPTGEAQAPQAATATPPESPFRFNQQTTALRGRLPARDDWSTRPGALPEKLPDEGATVAVPVIQRAETPRGQVIGASPAIQPIPNAQPGEVGPVLIGGSNRGQNGSGGVIPGSGPPTRDDYRTNPGVVPTDTAGTYIGPPVRDDWRTNPGAAPLPIPGRDDYRTNPGTTPHCRG